MTPRSPTNQRTEVVEVDDKKVNALLGKTAQSLPKEDHELFAAIVDSYRYLSDVISDKETTIAQLRKLMFGSKSEKYKDVVDQDGGTETSSDDGDNDSSPASLADTEDGDAESDDAPDENAEPPPGHGRHGADAYSGAKQVHLEHPSLCPGDDCPDCVSGTLYERSPGVLVRIVGRAPLDATVY